MRVVKSRAPSRVDFAGGTLDIPFFAEHEGGVTLNCAVTRYGYAAISEKNIDGTLINSLDYGVKVLIRNKRVVYDGKLDLLKAALKKTKFFENVEIITKHDMPPHSRLGTSSCISVALLAAICRFRKEKINKIKIADIATELERGELKLENGAQDEYAAALGGVNFLKFDGKRVEVERLRIKKETVRELEKNMLLCYTRQARISGDLNGRIMEKYLKGNEKIITALKNIKEITVKMRKQLINGDTEEFASLLNEERINRQNLDKSISNGLTKFINSGMKNGAIAAKILGAGGGGTILFYAAQNRLRALKNKLSAMKGRIYDFRFDFEGVKTWCV